MTVVSFSMAYRSFWGGSGRLGTCLDTAPSINRRHPNSCLALLQNRTYLGDIVHKGQFHPGEHTPIVDQPLWDAVQAQLASIAAERTSGAQNHQPSLQTRAESRVPDLRRRLRE